MLLICIIISSGENMGKAVIVHNLTIMKEKRKLLDGISLTFFKGLPTFLCGSCDSGKTLLLKSIAEEIEYEGKIQSFCKIVIIFDNSIFLSNTVEEELRYLLLTPEQKNFVSLFFEDSELKLNPNELSCKKKKLLLLCSFLWQNPEIVFIDNLYSFLEQEDIQKFTDYFQKHHITVNLVSNDIEQALHFKYMIVLDNGKVAMEGKTNQVLQEEKILKRLGIGLPFYVDLSIQLKYYNLIDKVYLNKEELVKKLWN